MAASMCSVRGRSAGGISFGVGVGVELALLLEQLSATTAAAAAAAAGRPLLETAEAVPTATKMSVRDDTTVVALASVSVSSSLVVLSICLLPPTDGGFAL